MTFNEILNGLAMHHMTMKRNKCFSDLISFDFKNRKISNGSIVLYDHGIIEQTLHLGGMEVKITKDMEIEGGPASVEELEQLYEKFKYSKLEPYAKYARENFVAVSDNDKLTREQFENAEDRQPARVRLESYVMFHDFSRFFTNEKHHYWKSNNGLTLYREWVKEN